MPKPDRAKFRPASKDRSSVTVDRTQLAGALKDTDGEPGHLKMDALTGSLRVNLWSWHTGLLRPVRQPFMDMASLERAIDKLTNSIDKLTAAIEAM